MSEQDERVGRLAAEERLRRVRTACGGWPARTWSQDIHAWQVETFGPATSPERAFARCTKEWDELLLALHESGPADVAEECADVAILLCRVAAALGFDLADEIEKKMAINRARKWPAPGTGPSQHIEDPPAP